MLQVLAATALLEPRNLLQVIPHHVHLVLLALIKLQQVRHLALSALLGILHLEQEVYLLRLALCAQLATMLQEP